jgi:hypothetical protein
MTDNTTTETAVDRIPLAHSVRYAARGLPEVPNQYGPGVLAPSEITLTYRAASDSQLGRVHAYVAGRIWVDGVETPLLPGGLYGQHYFDGMDGWPEWLAAEARMHDPDAPAVVPSVDRAALRDRIEVWPLQRVLTEVRCGSQDWTWEEEWADLDQRHEETGYLVKLEQQIRENGITMPVLIGSDGRLWDGHHRLRIAVRLGIGYVPVELTDPGDDALPAPADRAAVLTEAADDDGEAEKLAKARRMAKALSAPPVAPAEWATTTEWPGRHKRPGDRRVHATARFVVNDTQRIWTACKEHVGRGGTALSHMPVDCRACKRAIDNAPRRLAGEAAPDNTETPAVVYRSPGGHYLYCTRHTDDVGDSWTPLASDDLPDGGLCSQCGADVLIPQQPKEG